MDVKEITVIENKNEVAIDYTVKAREYLESMGTKLPPKHLTQFLELAQAYQLNPFKREIYAVGYGDNFNIITGFEVYLRNAEKSGVLDGWETEESGNVADGSLKSTITIYRKDRSRPFRHTVYYAEAVNKTRDGKPNSVWAKMPFYMTKKVAMAQGFRLCFPEILAGMPYTSDEIQPVEAPTEKNITPQAEAVNPYKMNAEQIEQMKKYFSDSTFTEEEKNAYRNDLANKKVTAPDLIEAVKSIYESRNNSSAVLLSQVFDGTVEEVPHY